MAELRLRAWATPLTIGSFILMAGTGVLMFFDWNVGLTTVVHQWFSWMFLAGAGAHVTLHVRSLARHATSLAGRGAIGVFTVVLLASLFSWGKITGPQLERPIMLALVDSPLSALAEVTRTDQEVLLKRLELHGIVATRTQSIRELATVHHASANRLLGLVFLKE